MFNPSDKILSAPSWAALIPEEQWQMTLRALEAAAKVEIPFLVGGGFGLAMYTGRWRNTKDMDLYVLPENRNRMIQAIKEAGFSDYYEVRPYDREWIYRSYNQEGIVDIIWAFANQRSQVDDGWYERAFQVTMKNVMLNIVPPEELLWSKLYVLQGDHSDWPDILNLIHARGDQLNWKHLRERVGEDAPLVHAVLSVFSWLNPSRFKEIRPLLHDYFELPHQVSGKDSLEERVRLLDSREWFSGLHSADKPLEI